MKGKVAVPVGCLDVKTLWAEDFGEVLEIGVGYRRVGLLLELLTADGRFELYPVQFISLPEV